MAVSHCIGLKVSKRDRWSCFLCLGLAHAIFLKCTQAFEITTRLLNGKQNVWVFGGGGDGKQYQTITETQKEREAQTVTKAKRSGEISD